MYNLIIYILNLCYPTTKYTNNNAYNLSRFTKNNYNTFTHARRPMYIGYTSIPHLSNLRSFSVGIIKYTEPDFSNLDKLLKLNQSLYKSMKTDLSDAKKHEQFNIELKNLDSKLISNFKEYEEYMRQSLPFFKPDYISLISKVKSDNQRMVELFTTRIKDIDNSSLEDIEKYNKAEPLLQKLEKNRGDFFNKLKDIYTKGYENSTDTNKETKKVYQDLVWQKFDKTYQEKLLLEEKIQKWKAEDDEGSSIGNIEKSESKPRSSLIDDFANPNSEQPSYMDPED